MRTSKRRGISSSFSVAVSFAAFILGSGLHAQPPVKSRPAPARIQSAGNAGTVSGVVTDPTGAVIGNATVTLSNSISGFSRSTTTDNSGAYTIANIPFNTYRLTVTASTMAPVSWGWIPRVSLHWRRCGWRLRPDPGVLIPRS